MSTEKPDLWFSFVRSHRALIREVDHLCCGSAGTYSVLQPEISLQLRDRKIEHLSEKQPDCIVSANIGCIQHLQSGTPTPVKHWIEVLDDAIEPAVQPEEQVFI